MKRPHVAVLIISLVGFLLIWLPFTSLAGWMQNPYFLILGFAFFTTSLIGSIYLFIKKERHVLLLTPFILLIVLVAIILSGFPSA